MISDGPGARFPVQSELQRLISSGENLLLARDQADVERLPGLVLHPEPDLPAPMARQYLAFLDSVTDRATGGIGQDGGTTRAQQPE